MKKRKDDSDRRDEAEFREMLGGHLASWDEAIDPPDLDVAGLVREHRTQLRGKQRIERLAFSVVSLLLVAGLLLLWQSSAVLFIVLQALVFAAAGGFMIVTGLLVNRERRGRS